MRKAWTVIGLAALLTSCASTQVALAPGDNGSVAVLDPKTGDEISVVDKAGSVIFLSGAKTKVSSVAPADFDKRFAALMAAMPREPKYFTLYFLEGSTTLSPESAGDLPKIFEEIKARPGADIQITGHTDTVGSEEVNDAFSLRRAAEVTSFLFTQGLDKAIVRLGGRGERELKEQTPDDTPSAINRRVEVIVR
jgi:outer membrane protein OmpA-like peptidoglycan-associated protein